MLLSDEMDGTNADGTKNDEYCLYCHQDGSFTHDCTMEKMIDFCSQFAEQYNEGTGVHLSREDYKYELRGLFPKLNRWKR